MANNNDYQLEEMENAAVNKSKNLKRGLVAGAAVLGVGGATAYGATHMNGGEEEVAPLTSEDLIEGAEAGAENIVEETHQTTGHIVTNEVHHTYVVENFDDVTNPGEEHQLDVNVEESSILFDDEGNVITTIDAGTIDGKDFMVLDTDLNGKGDVLAYDVNNNGVYEDNEILKLDNDTYEMGQGKNFHAYAQDEEGNVVEVYGDDMAQNDKGTTGIHNDFDDEKTGEYYHDDLADNNQDYNNHDGEQYNASMGEYEGDLYAQVDEKYDVEETQDDLYAGNFEEEVTDYGYVEPGDDLASFDAGSESFDDGVYDA